MERQHLKPSPRKPHPPSYDLHLIHRASSALLRSLMEMQDRITMLCGKLLRTRRPEEVYPISQQLRHAITEQVERVREKAVEVAIIDHIVDEDV
jgi:hypothetical protein